MFEHEELNRSNWGIEVTGNQDEIVQMKYIL